MKVTMTRGTTIEVMEQLETFVNMASLQIDEWEEEGEDTDQLEADREEVAQLLGTIDFTSGVGMQLEGMDEELSFELDDYDVELFGKYAADVEYRVETLHGEVGVTLGPQNNADAFAQFSDNIEPDGRVVKGEKETA